MSEEIPASPTPLLAEWLPANDDPVRPTMTVATVDGGLPDARTQLLTEYDEQGFYFHADSRSRKARQLAANPAAALVLHFPERRRQLVVQGAAEPAPPEELDRAYRARSRYLQQLAWQNTPEFASLGQRERIAAWAEFGAAHPELEPPATWTGWLLRPRRLTFWTGSEETASRRVEYRLTGAYPAGPWEVSILAG